MKKSENKMIHTTVYITESILKQTKQYNLTHQENPINISAVCRNALQNKIEKLQNKK